MPTFLDLLLLGAAAAITAVLIGVIWIAGFRKRTRLRSVAMVIAAIRRQDPDAEPYDIGLDRAGRAAGARLRDGRFAVARGVADGVAVRIFGAVAIKSVALRRLPAGATVTLTFVDFGFPPVTMTFKSDDFPSWAEALRHATRSA
jgi:hypothetical protein